MAKKSSRVKKSTPAQAKEYRKVESNAGAGWNTRRELEDTSGGYDPQKFERGKGREDDE